MLAMKDLKTFNAQYKILIVDDDNSILDLIEDILSYQGYQCFVAKSGLIALHILQEENPDLIITDVMMPEMDGVELIGKILAFNPEIKCIFMTGFVINESIVKAIDYQPIAFIKKPFMNDTLCSHVEKAFNDNQKISTELSIKN